MQLPEQRFHGPVARTWGWLGRLVSPRLRCFVSYRRRDIGPFAQDIGNALLRGSFQGGAFVDTLDTEHGEDWRRRLTRELARSDVVFVAIGPDWSPERLRSSDDAVRAELIAARYNRSTIVPLPIGITDPLLADDVPDELRFLADPHWRVVIPGDLADEALATRLNELAGPAVRRISRRKRWTRLAIVGALMAGAVALWQARAVEACDTSRLDVGVAVRLEEPDDVPPGRRVRPDEIADEFAATLAENVDEATRGDVTGPGSCAQLAGYDRSDTSDALAAAADLAVLVSGDVVIGDQASIVELSVTFVPGAVPDAPEVAGTHLVGRVTIGRNLDAPVVAEAAEGELAAVASVLDAFQSYSSGDVAAAADRFERLETVLVGTADPELVRVVGLLHANSLLLEARALSGHDADAVFDTALDRYRELATQPTPYARAHLGIGQVWTSRCTRALAALTAEPGAADAESDATATLSGLGEGLDALDEAERLADGDAETRVEVDLKARLGWGSLALCAAFLGDRELADPAALRLATVAETASALGFPNLASQANVALTTDELARCDPDDPDPALERALAHLEEALVGVRPDQRRDIEAAADQVARARTDAATQVEPAGEISTAIAGLITSCTS